MDEFNRMVENTMGMKKVRTKVASTEGKLSLLHRIQALEAEGWECVSKVQWDGSTNYYKATPKHFVIMEKEMEEHESSPAHKNLFKHF
jgi:hypothetical protein